MKRCIELLKQTVDNTGLLSRIAHTKASCFLERHNNRVLLTMFLSLTFFIASCQVVSKASTEKYREGLTAWNAGKQQQSILLLEQAVEESPSYYDACVKLGEFYRETEQLGKSREILEKAITLKSDPIEAHIALGKTYIETKEYLAAQHQFSQVLKDTELSEDILFEANLGKGICKFELSLTEDSAPYIKEALRLQPKHPEAVFYNALLLEKQIGPNNTSMKSYEQIVTNNPKHLRALKRMGDIWKSLEHDDKAKSLYQKFVEGGGQSPEVTAYIEQGKSEQLQVVSKEIIMVCPECGRIGKKSQITCDFDGIDLVPREDTP